MRVVQLVFFSLYLFSNSLVKLIDNLSGLCNNYYMRQLISNEGFTSVQKAQAGLTKVFKKAAKDSKFIRVLRNNEPLGVLVPNHIWESFIEDLEAMSSTSYLKQIAKSRSDKVRYSSTQIKKMLGIR